MTAADNSKGAGQDDDLPEVIEIVRAMGIPGVDEDNGPPPLPFRRPQFRRMMVRACRRISRSSPIERGTMSKRQAPPTPAAPMPPTGSIFARRRGGRVSTRSRPIREWSASISPLARAMLETLDRGTLRGLRDLAMLLLGFAGGLRRSEIVALDVGSDQEVARLVKRTALAAGVRGDLPEGERKMKFSAHSLRAGLASSAEVDERYVQKQLGHASAEMTRKYQRRRDRFRVNLTKASAL